VAFPLSACYRFILWTQVLKTLEFKGKRFLVIRNPTGTTGWDGPWSDGSKEWKAEWMDVLPILGHSFGDSGKFIMECTHIVPHSVIIEPAEDFFVRRQGFSSVFCAHRSNQVTFFIIVIALANVRRLFDSTWTMRYEVLRVPLRPFPGSGFGYGDLCCEFFENWEASGAHRNLKFPLFFRKPQPPSSSCRSWICDTSEASLLFVT
jgi:hypothetical protein